MIKTHKIKMKVYCLFTVVYPDDYEPEFDYLIGVYDSKKKAEEAEKQITKDNNKETYIEVRVLNQTTDDY